MLYLLCRGISKLAGFCCLSHKELDQV